MRGETGCADLVPTPPFTLQGARGATVGANDAFHDATSLPSYSATDVAAHCTRGDAWIVIRGRVYDVTRYVDLHPGGDAILRHAGDDATEGFEGPQHPSHVAMTVRAGCRCEAAWPGLISHCPPQRIQVEKYLIGSLLLDGDAQAGDASKAQ